MQTLIAWLPVLLCPLIMAFCLLPMLRGKGKCATKDEGAELTTEQVRDRLAQLQREELALRERLVAEEMDAGSPPQLPVAGDGNRSTRAAER